MIKKYLILIFFFMIFSGSALAKIETKESYGMIYVTDSTVEELEELFKSYQYTRFRFLNDNTIPAIFVKKLPSDYREIKSLSYRNELFIRILAPLAIKINEEIAAERRKLLRIEKSYEKNQKLTIEEQQALENLCLKYDYFTRLKDDSRILTEINNLKKRIDIIPPSILIAIAAMETNWGFARIANIANSLYKEKIWYKKEGIVPLENEDDGYHFKEFDSLIESMRNFALKFNSNIAYSAVWEARSETAKRHQTVLGETIAYTLATSSNLPNFAGIIDYTTAFYDFINLDMATLKGGLKQYEP